MLDRAIARHGYDVYIDGAKAGVVTSGTQTPFLKKAIGMAYLPADRAAAGHRVRDRRPRPPRSGAPSFRCRSTSARNRGQEPTCIRRSQVHERPRVGAHRRRAGARRHHRLRAEAARRRRLPGTAARSGRTLNKGDVFGTIESVKAVSELYSTGERRGHRGEHRADREAGSGQQGSARLLDDRDQGHGPAGMPSCSTRRSTRI